MRTEPRTLDGAEPDLLVVGGGIHGVAVAREAALAGLSVVLVEKDDFGAGTSSRSSRLIHGGLRYLEHGWWRMVREACVERTRLLANAPHLVWSLPTLMPHFRQTPIGRWKLRAGLGLYDLLAWGSPLPGARTLGARDCLRYCPSLRSEGLRGGFLYSDAATQDRLLTVAVAQGAAEAGARLANHVELLAATERGVLLLDQLTGNEICLRPARLINATGPWADRLRHRLGIDGEAVLRTTRGSHLLLWPRPMHGALAFFLPDRRIQFLVPGPDGILAGTTDVADGTDPDQLATPSADVDYLLQAAGFALSEPPARDQVLHAWTGLRSLVNHRGPEGSVPREALILEERAGTLPVWSVIGGKLTTHRSLAEKLVAKLLDDRSFRSRTRELPLPGGEGPTPDPGPLDRRALRLGSRLHAVLAMAGSDPHWLQPLCPHRAASRAEAVHAIRFLAARTLADLLLGRLAVSSWPCTEERCLREAHDLLRSEASQGLPFAADAADLRQRLHLLRGALDSEGRVLTAERAGVV